MVNFKEDAALSCLLDATLQPRHFPEIDLSKRQLQIWSNKAGIAAHWRDNPRTRRSYSPLEVVSLFVLKCLRQRLNAEVIEEEALLRFLADEEKFLFPAFRQWLNGDTPLLATDFTKTVKLVAGQDSEVTVPVQIDGTVSVAMAVSIPIEVMLEAVCRGGNDGQREVALLARGYRAARMQPIVNKLSRQENSGEWQRVKAAGRKVHLD